tara:strand:- start:782 stop:1615 length:834 start_codon:yes stop_codon:yes gene_type:complete
MKNQKFSNIYDLLDSKPKNISQLLGEFGEYVYRSYCRKQNYECKKVNYLEADVVIFNNTEKHFVDVKTTLSNSGTYRGRKTQKKYDYAYDQVFVTINFIKIYPDDNSLLKKFANLDNEILIENTNEQYQKYLAAPKEKKFTTNAQKKREELKKEIIKYFKLKKNLRCRVLVRGPVSENSWKNDKPHNVPGDETTYKKYNYNILINFKYVGVDLETVKDIYLFKTNLIGSKIKLNEPELNIQKNKNIKYLIDYDDFKKNNSKYYFISLDSFYNFIETI